MRDGDNPEAKEGVGRSVKRRHSTQPTGQGRRATQGGQQQLAIAVCRGRLGNGNTGTRGRPSQVYARGSGTSAETYDWKQTPRMEFEQARGISHEKGRSRRTRRSSEEEQGGAENRESENFWLGTHQQTGGSREDTHEARH